MQICTHKYIKILSMFFILVVFKITRKKHESRLKVGVADKLT